MEESTMKIAISALLHDIGKFRQRTGLQAPKNIAQDIYQPYNNQNNYFTHTHVLHTLAFFEDLKLENPMLRARFSDEIIDLAAKHHKPDKDKKLEMIITEADRLSSASDRGDDDYKGRNEHYLSRLVSLVSNVGQENNNFEYDLGVLSSNEGNLFPKKIKERNVTEAKEEYKNLYNKFLEKIAEIDVDKSMEIIFNEIYGILEDFTTFIPSATNSTIKDISLFDHLKTTTAIATCLEQGEDEYPFLLLEGDVSGIQKFIFKVTEGEDSKRNVAKSIRGRSFYVKMLTQLIAHYIVHNLKLPISNILYCGGGSFQLMLPNSAKVKNQLKLLMSKIEKELYNLHQTEISVVMTYIKLNKDDITKNYGNKVRELKAKVNSAKSQKYSFVIKENFNDFFGVKLDKYKNCDSCSKAIPYNSNKNLCDTCRALEELGGKIVYDSNNYICFDFENNKLNSVNITIGELGTIHILEEYNKNLNNVYWYHLNKSSKDVHLVLPYAKSMPLDSNNEILPFDELVEKSSIGSKKLGYLKMDVDNLGMLFGQVGSGSSLSKVTTFSRFMNMFFTKEIENICKKVSGEIINVEKFNVNNLFYINFSGGDDLFIIGPWYPIIQLGRKIREEFKRFSGQNDKLTVSAGISLLPAKFPIRSSVVFAEESLEHSKEYERKVDGNLIVKDGVTIFETSIDWKALKDNGQFTKTLEFTEEDIISDLELVINLSSKYNQWIKDNEISNSFLYRFMSQLSLFLEKETLGKYQLIPRMMYSITRNIDPRKSNQAYKHFKTLLMSIDDNVKEKQFTLVILAAKIAILMEREE